MGADEVIQELASLEQVGVSFLYRLVQSLVVY